MSLFTFKFLHTMKHQNLNSFINSKFVLTKKAQARIKGGIGDGDIPDLIGSDDIEPTLIGSDDLDIIR